MPPRSKTATIPLDVGTPLIVLPLVFRGPRGRRLLTMAFDTGATLTTLPPETALAIGCDPSRPTRRVEILTASGTEYVPVVKIPELELLGFRLSKVEVACMTLPPKSLVAGLLGLNVLAHFNILLGFLQKTLTVSR